MLVKALLQLWNKVGNFEIADDKIIHKHCPRFRQAKEKETEKHTFRRDKGLVSTIRAAI